MGLKEQARLRAAKAKRRVTRPESRSMAAVVLGAVVVVVSLAQWSITVAGIVAGLALVAYGLLFVDLDAQRRGRR